MPVVQFSDLELSVQFVSDGGFIDARAYIARETGQIHWESADNDQEEVIPDDVGDPDRYVEIPGQRELGLGKPLVMKFAAHHLPDECEEVEQIFRSKGAYARYKDLLNERGRLEEWYEFENAMVEEALIEWAESEGFSVEGKTDGTA